MFKKRATGLMSLAFIIVLASIFVVNQVDNDTWDDTHWGGDTGEEEYTHLKILNGCHRFLHF